MPDTLIALVGRGEWKVALNNLHARIAPRTWANLRRGEDVLPDWEDLKGAKLWTAAQFENVRRRLRAAGKVEARPGAAGPGQTVKVVELRKNGEVQKDLVYGSLEDLLSFRTPHVYLVEVDFDTAGADLILDELDDKDKRRPMVVVGDGDQVLTMKLALSTRTDLVPLAVNQQFFGYDNYPKLSRLHGNEIFPRLSALVGPVRDRHYPPYLFNRDLKHPRVEYMYMLHLLEPPPDLTAGQQVYVLFYPARAFLYLSSIDLFKEVYTAIGAFFIEKKIIAYIQGSSGGMSWRKCRPGAARGSADVGAGQWEELHGRGA